MLSRLPSPLRASSLIACSRNAVAAPAKRSVGVRIAGPDRVENGTHDDTRYRPEWLPHLLLKPMYVLFYTLQILLAHPFRFVARLTWICRPLFSPLEPLWPLQLHSLLEPSLGILISMETCPLLVNSAPTRLRRKVCIHLCIPGATRDF